MRRTLTASLSVLGLVAGSLQVAAADLEWQVENPFRFFKSRRSFALHEAAYNAVRGDGENRSPPTWSGAPSAGSTIPIAGTRRRRDRCAATAGKRYQQSRLGWAAQTLRRRLLRPQCARRAATRPSASASIPGARRKEDYVLPEAHTVTIRISPEKLEGAGDGECSWIVAAARRRRQGARPASSLRRQAHHRARSLFARRGDVRRLGRGQAARRHASSPIATWWSRICSSSRSAIHSPPAKAIPTGRSRSAPSRRDGLRSDRCCATRSRPAALKPEGAAGFGLAVGRSATVNPKVLPRRLMEDEENGIYCGSARANSAEAFDRAQRAVAEPRLPPLAIRLSGPRRHAARAGEPPPLGHARDLHLLGRRGRRTACSSRMDPREGFDEPNGKKVRAQLDQLSDLICRGGTPRAAGGLHAADVRHRQHRDRAAAGHA